MKNKTLCIAVSLFLALSMTACAGTQNNSVTSGASKEESTASHAASKPAEEVSAASDSKIVPRITGEEFKDRGLKGDFDDGYMTEDAYDVALEGRAISSSKTSPFAADSPVLNHAEAAETAPATTGPASSPAAAAPDEGKKSSVDAPSSPAGETSGSDPVLPAEPSSDTILPSDDVISGDPDFPIEIIDPVQPEPQAGLLTAGEWNDNANWGFFSNLVNSDTIQFPSFGLDPRYRYKTTVKNKDGQPVVNAKVTLYGYNNNVLWTTVTDHNGVAYMFATQKNEGTSFTVESDGKTEEYSFVTDSLVPADQQQGIPQTTADEANVTFDGTGKKHQKTDIMFILDATGSMSDEMLFLQKEFTAISDEVGDANTRYSVNFYRDKGDDYITKCYDFTNDIQGLQEKLNSESAEGGGDAPEAIAEIFEETIGKSNWDEDAVKLAFLIYDAPPHDGKEQSLQQSIKLAAEKGIHLIPVVSSGSERGTELFGRAAAIMTNGTYVFLTDDSGVGNSHMDPIIGSYNVEKLYDIIIRVINQYKQS